jgi:hypothetical protein
MRDPQWLHNMAASPLKTLWGHWLRPYELGGLPIVPPDAVPTPTGAQSYGYCPEQMFPGTFDSNEGTLVSKCFCARRASTVSTVNEIHRRNTSGQSWSSQQVSNRFDNGGNAWFAASPWAAPGHKSQVSLEWRFPEPASPAMRETVEWLVLYLALGWEVPAWGPVPGVWFNDSEWTAVLNRIASMVESRNDDWIRLPTDLRRSVPVRGINPIPVLSERLEMIRE